MELFGESIRILKEMICSACLCASPPLSDNLNMDLVNPSTYPLIAHKVSQSIPRRPLPLWDSDNHAKPSWPPIAFFSKHMLFLKKVYVFCFCRFEPKWSNGNMETDVQLAIFQTKFALKRWRERVRTPIIDMTTDQWEQRARIVKTIEQIRKNVHKMCLQPSQK